MAFSFLTGGGSSIAIDFGSASVKMLQVSKDDRPKLVAAAELPIPDSVRGDHVKQIEYLAEYLPPLLSRSNFKSRRATISVPGSKTLVQHTSLPRIDGTDDHELILSQLSADYGCPSSAIIAQHTEVCEVHRGGQPLREAIVYAIPREVISRYVNLLKKLRIEVVGVHAAPNALRYAFAHLNRRERDSEVTTCYVNLGWSGTLVTIANGNELAFARQIEVGGRHLDEQIASVLRCDLAAARGHRLAVGDQAIKVEAPLAGATNNAILGVAAAQAGSDATGLGGSIGTDDQAEERRTTAFPAPGVGQHVDVDAAQAQIADLQIGELLDMISDELTMSLRYHKTLFPGRRIDRVIFVGGEARQLWLCRNLASRLRVPAQLGDPITRLNVPEGIETPGLDLGEPQPGWAVACGLCNAPTDL